MPTAVKFGGLTWAGAVAAVPEGSVAGFILGVPDSPRNLDPSAATELIGKLVPGAEAWAETQDPSAAFVRTLFEEVGVDRIEVHGKIPEGLEFLELHHLVPSVPFPLDGTEGALPTVPPAEDFPRLHLAPAGNGLIDGERHRPNWELCRQVVDGQPGRKLTLAGGLDASNIAEAIAVVRPWGVGVTDAVLGPDGRMDPAKMTAFLAAVRAADGAGAGPP
jgi:phosphoribosylanthranilate isomerase